MATVHDFAEEFVRRARKGEKPVVRLAKAYAPAFFGELARQGFGFARACLDEIGDPELRRMIEVIFFSSAAGAALGSAIGGTVAGVSGARIGALVGVGVGFAAATVSLVLTVKRSEGRDDGTTLLVTVQ